MPPEKGGGGGGGGGGNNSSASSSPPPPAPTGTGAGGRSSGRYGNRRDSHGRTRQSRTPTYNYNGRGGGGGGSRKRSEEHLVLCVFRQNSHGWRTAPLNFDRYRTTDEELWSEIRQIYRSELQKPWRRIFLFTRMKHIIPIEFTNAGVAKRQDPKNYPDTHEFTHAYHHPRQIRTQHEWVDWFVKFNADPDKTYGLEFVEGLWAQKLAAVAVAATIATIVVSIVWCVKGGNLQTVFTVMSFVFSAFAAEIALVALYYQMTQQ